MPLQTLTNGNYNMEKLKFDHLLIGLLIGLITPTIGIVIFYYTRFEGNDLTLFFKVSIQEKMLSPLLSLCAVINLAVFYIFIYLNRLLTARGVILATFIYGLAIVLLKFGVIEM
jgi:hypothetical protein